MLKITSRQKYLGILRARRSWRLRHTTFSPPIERDGAGMLEIQLRLQKTFLSLIATDRQVLGAAAGRHSATALKRADGALTLEEEQHAVRLRALTIEAKALRSTG